MTFIYALKCPKSGQVKYIGKADHPTERLRSHLRAARSGSSQHRAALWIAGLLAEGLAPALDVLFAVPVDEPWQSAEKRAIAAALAAGAELTNSTSGGQGLVLLHESDRRAVALSMSAAWSADGARERRIAAIRRGNARPEAIANRLAAASAPETKKKREESLRVGLYGNAEVMARRRASQKLASNRPDVKAAKAAASRARWADPSFRNDMAEKLRSAWIKRKEDHA